MKTQDLEKLEKVDDQLGRVIRMINIILFIGKMLTIIIAAFVGISFALGIYNAVTGNIVWSVISLAFGVAGLILFVQIHQTRRRHYHRRARYQEARQQQKYREAEAA